MSHATRSSSIVVMFAFALAAVAAFSIPASAQENSGYTEDWSSHHVLFSNPGTEKSALDNGNYDQWLKITNHRRYIMQERRRHIQRWRGGSGDNSGLKRDWSMKDGADTIGSLTITVSGNDVTSTSAVKINGVQTFDASPPTSGSVTGTFTGVPTSGQSLVVTNSNTGGYKLTLSASSAVSTATITIKATPTAGDTVTIGGTKFCFGDTSNGCGGYGADDIVTINGIDNSASNLAAVIDQALTNPAASNAANSAVVTLSNLTGTAVTLATSDTTAIGLSSNTLAASTDGCTSKTGTNVAGSFPAATGETTTQLASAMETAIAACNVQYTTELGFTATVSGSTVTLTANTTGNQASGISLAETLSNFAFAGGATSIPNGTDGTDSATTFKYTTTGTADTAAQLAADLAAAFNDNTILTENMQVIYVSGATAITLKNRSTTSYAVSETSFTDFTGTGTLAANTGGSTVLPNTYPAKWGFYDTTTPTCYTGPTDPTTVGDFIVYPTGAAGSATNPNIVGYDNLYAGTCPTTTVPVPGLLFAYDLSTGAAGTAGLSPVVMDDGKQIAYIQNSSGGGSSAYLVLLKWAAGLTANATASCTVTTNSTAINCTTAAFTPQTLGAPISGTGINTGAYISVIAGNGNPASMTATLSARATGSHTNETVTIAAPTMSAPYILTAQTSGANYATCTAPCYYSIAFSGGNTDTYSAPFYTYNSTVGDTIFVGDDGGQMHKFSPVFNGTSTDGPEEIVSNHNWPATVSTSGNALNSPVYDDGTSQLVFTTDTGGYLYSIGSGTTPGTAKKSALLDCGASGFADGPVVDSTAEKVYVFNGGCSGTASSIAQFSAGTSIAGSSGTPAAFGNSSTNDADTVQYVGTFDNTYYSGSGTGGNLYACVNGTVYQVPITTGTFGTTVNAFSKLVTTANTNDAAACSPVTEYYNTGSDTDYLFVSLEANGTGTGCASGCIYNFSVTTSTDTTGTPADSFAASGGTSGIVVDNSGTGGASQVYYNSLTSQTCTGNGTTGSGGTGTCAVQVSQSALQ